MSESRDERDYRGRERDRDARQEHAYSEREDRRDEGIGRWQGTTEATIAAQAVILASQATSIQQNSDRITALQIQMATLKTQIGIWSALGGLAGAGVVSVVVGLVTK